MNRLLHTRGNQLYLDDEPFLLLAGEIPYFRIHPTEWRARLELARDFGLNTIQSYCPWNLHEPKKGVFDFEGMLDLGKFLALCEELGFYVLLRPSPYICGEWDFGGVPSWLVKGNHALLRSNDPIYLDAVRDYYREICKVFVPYLATNGGPIIAVAVENEYGTIANDRRYMNALRDIMADNGVDVPFFTTDVCAERGVRLGSVDGGIFHGINFRAKPGEADKARELHQSIQPEKPFIVGEFWSGRSIHWGEPFSYRKPQDTVDSFRESLELGAGVSFYIFSGGTNFGFMNGGVISRSHTPRPDTPIRYIPHCTSYEEDALIGEDGTPTEKYYGCREVLDRFLGKPVRPRETPARRTQIIPDVELTESARLLDNLDVLTTIEVDHASPLSMEDIGQDYGFLLYSKSVPSFGRELDEELKLEDVRDRATVYADGKYVGCVLRDRATDPLPMHMPPEGIENLQILVENMGRINGGNIHLERKGILGSVRYEYAQLHDWKMRALTLDNLSGLRYAPITGEIEDNIPVFLRGTFDAKPGLGTFVSTRGFGKGNIWINGFNLGRYWSIGPQMTLYVPAAILREQGNVIEILDVSPESEKRTVSFLDRHDFDIEYV
ncbi:MAG: beta-galactosidase [Ruminococcaceae bacterium]|nr:beta-galactosidase [Oscillospiraceae bacterium]